VWSGKGVGVLAFGASRRSIHRVAEKGYSPKFAGTEFYEVRIASVCNPSACSKRRSRYSSSSLSGTTLWACLPCLGSDPRVIRVSPDRVHLLSSKCIKE
jgi:hypothetical protein